MQTKTTSESGVFNPRCFALIFFLAAAFLAAPGLASTPSSGTLTDLSGPLIYMGGPFNIANLTPIPFVDVGPECNNPLQPCDDFALTVTLPSGYAAAHPNAALKFTLNWGDTGSGESDYDLYIYRTPRADCSPGDCTVTDGTQAADYQSAGGSNPEVATGSPVFDGTRTYTVVVVPYTPTNEIVSVVIELLPGSGGGGGGGPFGGPDPTTPGVPRYQTFYAPTGTSAQAGSGEFNIGFNPFTKRIMAMNLGPVWRLTPGEVQVPAKPECCEALWEDKSAVSTNTGLDPILWTDQKTGRTFASNSTAGANAVYAYTDTAPPFNDGDLWVEGGFSPPNGGLDHQTIGSGPYPLVLGQPNPLITPLNQGEAVYYCSQDIVGPAACQRSDTLGASYGPGVLAYTGSGPEGCAGLHGHVHVAPNGTVWLPVNQCDGRQGGAISTDNGVTWSEFAVTGSVSQINGADPSIAIDANNTAYYCYVNNEPVAVGDPPQGHVRAKVSTDGGATWIRDFDLGASHGVVNAAHTEAVGGSAGRAACGFYGTNVAGDYQGAGFPGKWYVFIATTFDGGVTWTTVNATPNDPVQSGTGIWQQGGGNQNRNLLDFNEVTLDDKGQVLYGYSDGCTSGPCIAGTAPNDYNAYMRIARQFGGKSLLAAFDPVEPVAPNPPCLSGTRDAAGSHLTWKIPDNGGSDITGYQILRGTESGNETVLVNNTGDARDTYNDITALPSVPHYFYVVKAINALGIGPQSNEIDLTVGAIPPPETPCLLPGLTILIDPPNDSLSMVAAHDVQSLQISESFAFAPSQIVFTLKMQSLATIPPNTRWPVSFTAPNNINYTVRMTNVPTDGATTTPIFQVGPSAGPFVAAAASSNFNVNGTITMVVPTSAIGSPAVGQNLTGFLTRIAANVVAGTITPDNMPDSLTPTGAYTVIGNQACAPNIAISGTVSYCTNPVPGPVPNVTLTLTGNGSGSTFSDASGNYQFSSLVLGTYTVTPTKGSLAPASAGINTVDALAAQRHFLVIGVPLSGCKLTAADVNDDSNVNTVDTVAIQKFYLGFQIGIANVGNYNFTPANRTYTGVGSSQTGQDYATLVFGDVVSGFVEGPESPSEAMVADDAGNSEITAAVASVVLPDVAVAQARSNLIAAVNTSELDVNDRLVGFQGDFTFDERVVTFQSPPVQKAGATSGNWNVSGNVLPGAGPIRTLRISAFSNDFTPLSGSGTLFELRMTKVSKAGQTASLLWAAPPDQFIFIDADLKTHRPGKATPGRVRVEGVKR